MVRMSASRPKLGKIKPKPRVSPAGVAPYPALTNSQVANPSGQHAVARTIGASSSKRTPRPYVGTQQPPRRPEGRPVTETDRGKARSVSVQVKPISVYSTSSKDEDEDEDEELEEVPIPSGPSSPYPGPPHTPGTTTNPTAGTTPGTATTAPSVDDEYAEYGESSSSEGNEVIRLEIGGETEEEKARRIALALRK
jgi:xeroderma pigmentosum group C-complementing protein